MIDKTVFPIYSYQEIGLFLEIVHDQLKEKQVNFATISMVCEELDDFLTKCRDRLDSFILLIEDSIKIEDEVNGFDVGAYEKIKITKSKQGIELAIEGLVLDYKSQLQFERRQNDKQKSGYVQLLNESLKEKNKQIQRMYESKSYLINFLAHEIRNPLTAILNSVELMRAAPEAIESLQLDKVLENVSSDMKKLVDEVLDFSKLETNKLQLELSDVPLKQFCTEFSTYGKTLAESKGLEWKTSGVSELNGVAIKADSFRVRQILSNLVGNSIKFTEQGRIEMSVGVEQDRAVLGIHDTGKGIKDKFQSSIFKEFSQESAAISREFGGSGLGLNICYNLSQKMNGELWFESEAGKGTSFFVSLPLS